MSLFRFFALRSIGPLPLRRRLHVESLEARDVPSVTLAAIPDSDFPSDKPLFVAAPATASGGTVTYSVSSSNPGVTATVVTGGVSIDLSVTGTAASGSTFSGDIILRLFQNEAPNNTNNFITLVNDGYYNGLEFSRVISDFVAQAGSPTNNDQGGSTLIPTDTNDEFNAAYTFASRGILAMANSGNDTNNAQFFITDPDTLESGVEEPAPLANRSESLDYKYTILGILTSGFDTFEDIMNTPVTTGYDGAQSKPVNPVTITKATVITDDTNGLIEVSANSGFLGTSNITVTATQGTDISTQTFAATSVTDTVNDPPFLGTINNLTTTENTPVSFQIPYTEIDAGDTDSFAVGTVTDTANGPVFSALNSAQATATVDATGKVTITPATGYTGTVDVTVGVRDQMDRVGSSLGLNDAGNYNTQHFNVVVNASTPANTAPTISSIANQSTTTSTAVGPISFTVGDAETAPASLTLSAASTNTTLLPTANVVFGGSGADRTVTLRPVAGQTGTAIITVTVTDGGGLTASSSFTVKVSAPANTPPQITQIVNQTTTTGTPVGPLSFTVADAETPVANLTLTAASSNTTLVPVSGIVLGGSGASRTATITPASGQTGSATITITVTDAGGLTANSTFVLTVNPATSNTAPTIGSIADLATGEGIATGPVAFTIGDAETPAANLTLAAASANTTLVPAANVVFGGSGANRTLTVTPAAGQTGTAAITVTVTDAGGLTATRTFNVVVSATAPANTPPTISSIANQSTGHGAAVGPVSFTIGDAETAAANLNLTAASSNATLIPVSGISFGGSGASRTVTITPATGQSGTATITLTVNDAGDLTASTSFTVTVAANTAPTITSIANQSTTVGTAISPISFTLGDDDPTLSDLKLSATSSNTALLPVSGVTFGGTPATGARTLTITPVAGQTGSSTVTITVTDIGGLTATQTFTLTVNPLPITVKLTSTKTATTTGLPVLFSAVVTNGGTGSVQFLDGTTVLGTVPVVDGKSFLSTSFSTDAAHSVTAKFVPATGTSVTSSAVSVTVTAGTAPISITATGSAFGSPSNVTIKNADGSTRFSLDPFGSFTGGVFVKVADVTNDGQPDVVAVPGFGGGPIIAIIDGTTGKITSEKLIFESSFRGGLSLDVGDAMGLGYSQILVGAGIGGGPRVTLYDAFQKKVLLNYFAYSQTNRGGVSVALSDLRGGNYQNIITGAGVGLPPDVNVYNPYAIASFETPTQYGTFVAGTATDTTGIRVGAGDLSSSNVRDVLVGTLDKTESDPLDQTFNPVTLGVFTG